MKLFVKAEIKSKLVIVDKTVEISRIYYFKVFFAKLDFVSSTGNFGVLSVYLRLPLLRKNV